MCKEFDELIKNSEKKGMEIGVEKGIEIGREKGVAIGRDNRDREIVANAMAMDMSVETIADLMKLPVEAVKQIADQCKAETVASL